ncbi:MAG: hypothetical protein ABR536_05685 [Solirubrobacterales bacterium]
MKAWRGEQGMTMVEVLVAGLLLVISGTAVLGVVNTSARNSYRGQQSQVVSNRLQSELERITQLPYRQIALTGVTATSSDPNDPNNRVSGTNFAIDKANTILKPLAYNGGSIPQAGGTVSGGGVAPGGPGDPTAHFSSGNVSGTIYRYVVWDNHASCPAPLAPCLKRVVVAVKLDSTGSGGPRLYQELQGQVFDPEAKRSTSGNPGGPNSTPWTFSLTDTACNFATRQAIQVNSGSDGHATHNTRSTCGTANSGPRFGSNAGPPDLMLTHAGDFPNDQQPLYDYAVDVEPSSGPTDTDKGLQELNSGSCDTISGLVDQIPALGSLLDSNNYLKVHKWLAPKVPSGFNNILFSGTANLNLWTQTINNGVYPGGICAWLFVRQLNILGQPVDTPVLGGAVDYFSYQQNPWPHGGWQEISMPMTFPAGISLPPSSQLGLAIAVDSSNTGGGLEFGYDAPSYDSRLQIQTTGSLPF